MAEQNLTGITASQKLDGSWQAVHDASGRVTHGLTKEEACEAMTVLLDLSSSGSSMTSDRFDGIAKEIALHLEGPVSDMLKLHAGYARLEAYHNGLAHVRLVGACQGCPSSLLTLSNGVRSDLQHTFGEDVVQDVLPVIE